MPLVSVIVPCWNAELTLSETLESIAGQTYRDWEAIVVDDGSNDGSALIAAEWQERDARFIVVRQANGGLSVARNRGIEHARGEFLLFLDADDLIASEKLAHQLPLAQDSREQIVYSDCTYFSGGPPYTFTHNKDGSDRASLPGYTGTAAEILPVLAQGNIMPVSAPLLPRHTVMAVGGFDPALSALEDWDYWIRCALAGWGFTYDSSPAAFTMIRLRPGSMSTHDMRMMRNELRVRGKHRNVPAMRAVFREKRRFHLKAAVADLLKGRWKQSAGHAGFASPRFW